MFDKIKKLYTNYKKWMCELVGLNYEDVIRIEPVVKLYYRAACASIWHWLLFNIYWKIGNMNKAGYHYDHMRWSYKDYIGYEMMIKEVFG